MNKKKPTGFVAICQCGKIIGAMDYTRTDRKDAGKLLGEWLAGGCKIEPRFKGSWSEKIATCEVSQQRELLLSFAGKMQSIDVIRPEKDVEKYVNNFLTNNCR